MDIKQIPITDVVPYNKNPRNNDGAVESTANSIKEFGWQQPIVVDKNNIVIVGHTRLKAAEKLKLDTVPVLVADNLSEEQVKAYRLVDNKTGELADWDMALLNEELEGIAELDMDDFGFELAEDAEEVVDDDFDVEVPDEPTSKLGQIYQLGNHRLMVGDSTDTKQVEALMGGQQADLLVTDPPYNVALGMGGSVDEARKRHRRTDGLVIMNDKMEDSKFREFLVSVYTAAKNNMKAGASFYIWHADSERFNFEGAAKDVGWQVRETLIWNKNSITLGRQDYQWKHEPCLYGWNEGGSHAWYSDRKQSTVLNFDRPTSSKLHPTMKPVPLFDYQIKNSSKQGDLVLDLFGGSGTTMIACEQNGRHAYLMELDPKYTDVIITRWEEFTGKKAELVQE
ncbi:DNA modification methylase [Weissella thailandensis]|uniref:Methyltransferase n=1 Tax=Weissella thailandensis TaxID=89061 RepID=A0ABX9I682_9LACO|nr:DNA modification methylase [Weissella thailandensis]NKY90137.1 ParB N-terminal domain-containing protein [Weissella thailandensis]RDS60216.1 site-specific DNA-methyltransferase [Weissella thailandensis]GEP74129.1 methyltransferase [Weissella thailandensis]